MPKAGPFMEILVPAGDEEMMRAAVFSGADCVYLGLRGFNARRGAGNFDAEGLARAMGFCHARGCKVYVALNTLVFPGREEAFAEALRAVDAAGCDAAIVQDLAAVALAKQVAPRLALHASTQMSVHSPAGLRQLAQLGFSRVILARELRFAEIEEMAKCSPIELEVFVHGALCLSVSGQCYFSALLGGRSGNRGGCAGPCRLPFRCGGGEKGPAQEDFDLSLRDLSILKDLPKLAEIGVASAKIEGRLRGAEYVAAVTDAARRARRGEAYDEGLLRDIFSRGAFTGGWFAGHTGRGMFGRRAEGPDGAGKKALAKARALYRREMPRVPVTMRLALCENGAELAVSDGKQTLKTTFDGLLTRAEKDAAPALRQALGKTGGTPFYLREEADATVETGGWYAPAGMVTALRRQALEELLALREAPPEKMAGDRAKITFPAVPPGPRRRVSGLRGRFASLAGVPPEAGALCAELLLPLKEAENIPQALREKTRLTLPRFLPGNAEQEAAEAVRCAAGMGFLGFEANNISHLKLCEGLPLAGGFGLNVTNALAAEVLRGCGCDSLTLTFELSLTQMRQLAGDGRLAGVALDCVGYGHLPLVLTRACPLKKAAGCGNCLKTGVLTDRKGRQFRLDCRDGMRTLYNPVPLWMGDRLADLPVDSVTLSFTHETPEEAGRVLRAFAEGNPADGPFTRGLYDRGTEE